MSQENVEVVRRMFAAFRDGDWAAAFEPVDPDIEMDTTRTPIQGLDRVYKGRDEVAGFWVEWLEAWGEQRIEDPELIDARDKVVMCGRPGIEYGAEGVGSRSVSLRMRG